jgi:hypothetical protein
VIFLVFSLRLATRHSFNEVEVPIRRSSRVSKSALASVPAIDQADAVDDAAGDDWDLKVPNPIRFTSRSKSSSLFDPGVSGKSASGSDVSDEKESQSDTSTPTS